MADDSLQRAGKLHVVVIQGLMCEEKSPCHVLELIKIKLCNAGVSRAWCASRLQSSVQDVHD